MIAFYAFIWIAGFFATCTILDLLPRKWALRLVEAIGIICIATYVMGGIAMLLGVV